MKKNRFYFQCSLSAWQLVYGIPVRNKKTVLLNVSYDVIRDFYKEYNIAFQREFPSDVMISQSHGGASKQVLGVLNGLPADVVTLTQSNDIDALVKKRLSGCRLAASITEWCRSFWFGDGAFGEKRKSKTHSRLVGFGT